MSRIVHSSGDLIADRRFDYAQSEMREGNAAAAADLFRQVLELTPDWPPAWFGLGDALAAAGDRSGAITAFQHCAERDGDDVFGARVALAALGEAPADMPAMSGGYVRDLFDQYADRFDKHLTKNLAYRGPELVRDAVLRAAAISGHGPRFDRVLDLGCGTGLFAEAFRDHARHMSGVDLSPRMIERAKKRGVYQSLHVGGIGDMLAQMPAQSCDLVSAVDVFVYIGALDAIFAGVKRIMPRRGLFAFTVQAGTDGSYAIGADRRYWHSETYLRQCAGDAGLSVVTCERDWTRKDRDEPVPSLIMVCEHASTLQQRLK